MQTRVLVLSASVGAGHLRAAEAVELALKKLAPEIEVENRDVLEFTTRHAAEAVQLRALDRSTA